MVVHSIGGDVCLRDLGVLPCRLTRLSCAAMSYAVPAMAQFTWVDVASGFAACYRQHLRMFTSLLFGDQLLLRPLGAF
eukprot:4155413-Pyramimonas_sp.AAC.1